MVSRIIFSTLLLLSISSTRAQPVAFSVPRNVHIFISDTTIKRDLLYSLDTFLGRKDDPADSNHLVDRRYWLETSALLDELKNSGKRAYLTNIVALNDSIFSIQFSYMGLADSTPQLRSSFRILAIRNGAHYSFGSPLMENTLAWRTTSIGNVIFHYKTVLDQGRAEEYQQKVAFFDQKLKAPEHSIDFYCCSDFVEALDLIGVEYKSDYNGWAYNSLSAFHEGAGLYVCGTKTNGGFNHVDYHDLWHDRLHNVLPVKQIYKPVDEGCAYLYGGSWGIAWPAILDTVRNYASAHPDANWLDLYNKSYNFSPPNKFPLNADFAINALIVQKIEREKGFSAVMELLSCGKATPDNENYFQALNRLTGITRQNFSDMVKSLIAHG